MELISVCRMSFSDQKCPTKTVKVAVQELFDEINLMLCGRIVHQTKSGKVPTNKIIRCLWLGKQQNKEKQRLNSKRHFLYYGLNHWKMSSWHITPNGKRSVLWSCSLRDQLTGKGNQLTGGHGRHGWGTLDNVGEVAWLRSTGGCCVSLESEKGKE